MQIIMMVRTPCLKPLHLSLFIPHEGWYIDATMIHSLTNEAAVYVEMNVHSSYVEVFVDGQGS